MVDRATNDERQLNLIKALRVARKDMNLTQIDLAQKLGRRQQFVSKYESGERRLDFFEVLDVTKALGLTMASLLHKLDEPLA